MVKLPGWVTLPGKVRPPDLVIPPVTEKPQDLDLLREKVKRPVREKLQVIPQYSFYRYPILPPPKLLLRPDVRGLHRKHTARDFSNYRQGYILLGNYCLLRQLLKLRLKQVKMLRQAEIFSLLIIKRTIPQNVTDCVIKLRRG